MTLVLACSIKITATLGHDINTVTENLLLLLLVIALLPILDSGIHIDLIQLFIAHGAEWIQTVILCLYLILTGLFSGFHHVFVILCRLDPLLTKRIDAAELVIHLLLHLSKHVAEGRKLIILA